MPVAAAGPADTQTRPDLDPLQGAWTTVAGPREARLLVAGNRFAFEFVGGDIYMGTFSLSAGDPRQMDMRIEEGPTAENGKTALCIYHVEGDVLRWCPGRPGGGRRHSHFPSVDDPRYVSLVFRHVRARRGK